ncbi:MAG: hypothetical protein IKR25_02045 [Muribaculaceae bacterium]|nr:hypothetical protein [Muribaculaceae bacterium]
MAESNDRMPRHRCPNVGDFSRCWDTASGEPHQGAALHESAIRQAPRGHQPHQGAALHESPIRQAPRGHQPH